MLLGRAFRYHLNSTRLRAGVITSIRHPRIHGERSIVNEPILRSRWLHQLKSRIGRCITFGLSAQQTNDAGLILSAIARDWRELVAGREGFLTSPNRRGLFRKEVVWGDMPMTWPDRVSVYHKLREKPRASTESFMLDVIILSERNQRPAARCVEDIVMYNYRLRQKSPLPGFMLDRFQETFDLQESTKEHNTRRVEDLINKVGILERASWNRVDAKEDFGTASP